MNGLDLRDAPRAAAEPGAGDALTFAFCDAAAEVCGIARLGISAGAASGLVVVFTGGDEPLVAADGAGEAGDRWEEVRAAGIETETLEDGRRWRVRCDGEARFDLEFASSGAPLVLPGESPVGRAGGMEGFDHVCRVRGTVGGRPFEGRGQRGRSRGAPDWERMALARTVAAWFADGRAISAVAVRPARSRTHADETLAATLLDADGGARAVAEPRLSTTYDAEGRQRAAGLELYLAEDDPHALRAAGEAVAGTSLDLGRLALDCAFFRWRMGGSAGVGRYDVLRRTR